MKYPLAIDQDQLVQAIYDSYKVKVTSLEFIPVGYAAACYKANAGSDTYFLKLWPEVLYSTNGVNEYRECSLRLVRALYDRNIYKNVSLPLYTSAGTLSAKYSEGSFALFPFLYGSPLPENWSTSLQDTWARTLACLHNATKVLSDVLPLREQFELSFLPDLENCFLLLEKFDLNTRPGIRTVRDLILSGQQDIYKQIARLKVLQEKVKRLDSPFVLCHTDMGSDNLLLGDRGELYVLDWEEAMLAPPEHDLHEARWIGVYRTIQTYLEEGGATPLYLDQFAFYLLRRALGDMTVRIVRALNVNSTDEEDEDAIIGIQKWGFEQWASLDTTLNEFASALL